jgi:hypothetical protein
MLVNIEITHEDPSTSAFAQPVVGTMMSWTAVEASMGSAGPVRIVQRLALSWPFAIAADSKIDPHRLMI